MENNSSEDLYTKGKSMKNRNILGIVLWFTIIGAIVSIIISLIDAIIILSTDFKNKELNDEKILWGVLSLVLLGNIACLIFANKMISAAEVENNMKQEVPQQDIQKQDNNKIELKD
ncbi:MAG: hypothetical protein KFW07_00690 [Mycoplasmataceae bacterium]|nr:hypothetical protein [Mycoplasmataceae bacterium]